MQTLRNTVFTVTVAGMVVGVVAGGAVAVGITGEKPRTENPAPIASSEPSWTDTSTLIIGGYETPSADTIATTPPLSAR